MFSSIIENLLMLSAAKTVTELFLYLITIVFIYALYSRIKHKHERFTSYAATLMTSIGILGTFVGIVIGLLGFDTTDVAGSIPALLDGLKTAFITSVYGLFWAAVFNVIVTVFLRSKPQQEEGGVSADEIRPIDI